VILVSTGNNTAEKDHPNNLSLAGDGFDTVVKAKAAVDAVPACTNQVSCADILALATRDVIALVRTLVDGMEPMPLPQEHLSAPKSTPAKARAFEDSLRKA